MTSIDDNPQSAATTRSLARAAVAGDDRDALEQRVIWLRTYTLVGDLLVGGLRGGGIAPLRTLLASANLLIDFEFDEDGLTDESNRWPHDELELDSAAFLGVRGCWGDGGATATLMAAHRALGLRIPTNPGPGHLGQALRLMAALVDAELEAATHGDRADVETLRRWQTRVLDDGLLPWMPPLLATLSGQPPSLWTRAVELAVRALASHRTTDASLPYEVGGGEIALFDEHRIDRESLVDVLSIPRYCGAYLSRRDLASVAQRCDVLFVAGDRKGMLELMLARAIDPSTLGRVVAEVAQVLATRDDLLATLASEPGLAPHVPVWRRRITRVRELLGRPQPLIEQLHRVRRQEDESRRPKEFVS